MNADHHDPYFYRNEVLDAHLLLEDQVNTLLELAFQVHLPSSLSNNYSKLDLLLDLGIIDEMFKDHFQLFSRIRNKFIHELGCRTFTDLPLWMRKMLLASEKLPEKQADDNTALFEAYKRLYRHLINELVPQVKKALHGGVGTKVKLEELHDSVGQLIDYICEKYPEERREELLRRFIHSSATK